MLPTFRPPELDMAEAEASAGRYESALAHCYKVLQKIPGHVGAINIMAGIDIIHGRKDAGEQKLRAILEVEPDHPEALNNLGVLMEGKDRQQEAEILYKRSAAAKPDFPDPWLNLGVLFHNLRRREEAQEAYERALVMQPKNVKALGLLGLLYMDGKKFDKAIECFRRAIDLEPDDWFNIGNLINGYHQANKREGIPPLLERLLKLEFKGGSLYIAYNTSKAMCFWDETAAMLEEIKREIEADRAADIHLFSCIMMMLGEPAVSNDELFTIHKQVGKLIRKDVDKPYTEHPGAARPGKLRIGLISPDFRAHVVSYFIRGPVNFFDQDRFELYCYSNTVHEDEVTEDYKNTVTAFHDIRKLSDREAAELIHSHGVQVLVDIAGYTSDTRIGVLGYRPAPVQITYLGYPYSSGMSTIDYIIADPYLVGDKYARYTTEKPLSLPQSAYCFGDFLEQKIDQPRPLDRNGYVTFGCMINPIKMNRELIVAWAQILAAVPDSRLYLNHPYLDTEATRSRIRREFEARGVAGERILCEHKRHPSKVHLRWYNQFDIVLDTMPMTGGTSTMEAVWMGLPVVTKVGDGHQERISYSVLKNIGVDVDELIAFDVERYIAKAIALGKDPERIRYWHQTIPQALTRSILCDPILFARHFEYGLVEAWNRKFPEYAKPMPALVRAVEPVELALGGEAVVPQGLSNPVGYALREHRGWYDPEYRFAVERLARPPQVIDISRDFGAYALPIARRLGDRGKTLAITTPGQMFALIQEALHAQPSSLRLLKAPRLAITLDEGRDGTWGEVSFIRIGPGAGEAKGRLVEDWKKIFQESSPVVLCSIRDDEKFDLSNAMALEQEGYRVYRYVPLLQALLPLGESELDALSLNVVLCKPDRAAELAGEGLLLENTPQLTALPAPDAGLWQAFFQGLPYFASLGGMESWQPTKEWGDVYSVCLNLYAIARDEQKPLADRAAALKTAASSLDALVQTSPSFLRQLTAARVFAELGLREKAATLMVACANQLMEGAAIDLDEPFLAPLAEMEAQTPQEALGDWLVTGTLAAREIMRSHSFSFTASETLQMLQGFESNPWCSESLKARLRLAQALMQECSETR